MNLAKIYRDVVTAQLAVPDGEEDMPYGRGVRESRDRVINVHAPAMVEYLYDLLDVTCKLQGDEYE